MKLVAGTATQLSADRRPIRSSRADHTIFALTALLAATIAYRSTHRAGIHADAPVQPDTITRHVHARAAGRA
ncbi:MAG TPA: hypothetical protein VIJ28_16770 [Chloroflexota bacterium]|jgi:hypothetical protein